MEGILHKGYQIPHLERTLSDWLQGEPNNGHNHPNQDMDEERVGPTH